MSGLSRWFWLGVPLKVTVKVLVEAASSEDWMGAQSPLLRWPTHIAVGQEFQKAALLRWQPDSPRTSHPKESEEESFHDLDLEVSYHHSCFILFLRSKSLNPALAKGNVSKEFEHILTFLTEAWWFLKHITPFQLRRPWVGMVQSSPRDRTKGGEPIQEESLK